MTTVQHSVTIQSQQRTLVTEPQEKNFVKQTITMQTAQPSATTLRQHITAAKMARKFVSKIGSVKIAQSFVRPTRKITSVPRTAP